MGKDRKNSLFKDRNAAKEKKGYNMLPWVQASQSPPGVPLTELRTPDPMGLPLLPATMTPSLRYPDPLFCCFSLFCGHMSWVFR